LEKKNSFVVYILNYTRYTVTLIGVDKTRRLVKLVSTVSWNNSIQRRILRKKQYVSLKALFNKEIKYILCVALFVVYGANFFSLSTGRKLKKF